MHITSVHPTTFSQHVQLLDKPNENILIFAFWAFFCIFDSGVWNATLSFISDDVTNSCEAESISMSSNESYAIKYSGLWVHYVDTPTILLFINYDQEKKMRQRLNYTFLFFWIKRNKSLWSIHIGWLITSRDIKKCQEEKWPSQSQLWEK